MTLKDSLLEHHKTAVLRMLSTDLEFVQSSLAYRKLAQECYPEDKEFNALADIACAAFSAARDVAFDGVWE